MSKKTKKYMYSRSEARENLPELLNIVCDSGEPVYIANRGKKEAVLVSIDEYDAKKDKKKFSDWGLVGMWELRDDLKDSVKWVRKIREEEEEDL